MVGGGKGGESSVSVKMSMDVAHSDSENVFLDVFISPLTFISPYIGCPICHMGQDN